MQKLVGVLLDVAKAGGGLAPLLGPMKLFALALLAEAGLGFLYYALITIGCDRMATRLRQQIYESILKQDIAFFDSTNTGELLTRLSGDVDEVRRAVKYAFVSCLHSS